MPRTSWHGRWAQARPPELVALLATREPGTPPTPHAALLHLHCAQTCTGLISSFAPSKTSTRLPTQTLRLAHMAFSFALLAVSTPL
eukprot:534869-Lingulodinium_polyedra.AAC.1